MENPENQNEQSELAVNRGDSADYPIIDSDIDRAKAIFSVLEKDSTCAQEVLERQSLFPVIYLSPDGKFHQGQIVIERELQTDVEDLFALMLQNKFPITLAKPIEAYGWDDELSMSNNNSSAYNHRVIKGTPKLSLHAFGLALDINPKDNPVIVDGKIDQPANGLRDLSNPHTLTPEHFVVQFMKERGWVWGGDWQSFQDYHHFEKRLATPEYIDYLHKMLDMGYIEQEEFERNFNLAKQNSHQN